VAKQIHTTKISQNVTVTILASDNAKGSFQNVVTVVLSRSEDGMYELGTKENALINLYSRS
jgi:hypothetical protein